MSLDYSENAFEAVIEHSLLTGATPMATRRHSIASGFIFPVEALAFVQATRPQTWQALERLHGPSPTCRPTISQTGCFSAC